jgi:hypothetical protein
MHFLCITTSAFSIPYFLVTSVGSCPSDLFSLALIVFFLNHPELPNSNPHKGDFYGKSTIFFNRFVIGFWLLTSLCINDIGSSDWKRLGSGDLDHDCLEGTPSNTGLGKCNVKEGQTYTESHEGKLGLLS